MAAAQSAERSGTHQIDTDPVGLRKFDLGLVPASVTPPRTWRHAAWFTVLCSACVLMSLLLAVNALVGHSRQATIDAMPNYPGEPGLLPTTTRTTRTASSSEAPASTTRLQGVRPVSNGSVEAWTSPRRPTDTAHGGRPVDGGPTSTAHGDPIGDHAGDPIGDQAGDSAQPSNHVTGTPQISGTHHAGAPPTMPIHPASIYPAPSPPTSSTEPGAPPPSSSTRPTRVPAPSALPTITTTSDHGAPSASTLDVAKLVELTQRFYNAVDKDLHDAFTIATGGLRAAGYEALQKRYQGITRMGVEAIEVDANRGVTLSTVRVTKQDGSVFRQRRALGFATDGLPLIQGEQVVPSEGHAQANAAADSTTSLLPRSME
jgi:hypothetical protein